jgi:NADP-dependent 3-hydroxy acid dehydrogenase YdfG
MSQQKVAWVTGAGTGIGEGSARALAAAGMVVALSGRREAPLQEVADDISSNGGAAMVLPLDVSDAEAVNTVVENIKKEYGRLDVLVHSAGLNREKRVWKDTDKDSWDTVIRVNLDGAFYCCNAVLPIMREQKEGTIINISSWAGRNTSLVAGMPYSASKSALNSLTETINMEECVNGIRACAICPGEVATPILDRRPKPPSAEDRAKMLQPEDLGEIVAFIAQLHPRVCINDLLVSPTWNRAYVGFRESDYDN